MATIIPKKTVTAGKVPSTADLDLGEIAINYEDATLYGRHPNGTIVDLTGAKELHTHTISQVSGLQTSLDGKSDDGHTHDDRYYTETEADSRFVNVTGDESISGVKTFSTALAVTGTGKAAGRFYAGTTDPTNTTRTNYDGDLHARGFGTGRFKIEYNADSESLDFIFG